MDDLKYVFAYLRPCRRQVAAAVGLVFVECIFEMSIPMLMTGLVDVGVALGPIFLGALISATGYSAMYLLLAGLVAVAGVFYFFVHGRRPQAKQGYADA